MGSYGNIIPFLAQHSMQGDMWFNGLLTSFWKKQSNAKEKKKKRQ